MPLLSPKQTLSEYAVSTILYYYKLYIYQCRDQKTPILLRPQIFYYLQPLFIYFYAVAFTQRSLLFTLLSIELFYTMGKSGDLINKNEIVRYSNDFGAYKIFKFFNHSAFHMIFYMKLFFMASPESPSSTYKYGIFALLQLFQLGMYVHKSYQRRLEFIDEIKAKPKSIVDTPPTSPQQLAIYYPSYYKIPIITSNEVQLQRVLKYTELFTSENYYFYLLGFVHLYLLGIF
jgi:hypothetical protein